MARAHAAARPTRTEPPPGPGTCHGVTRKGSRCRRSPGDGEIFCSLHRDQAEELAREALDEESRAELAGEGTGPDDPDLGEEVTGEQPLGPAEEERLERRLWQRIRDFLRGMPEGAGAEWLHLARDLYDATWERIRAMNPLARGRIHEAIQEFLDSDYLDPDFWEGLWWILRSSLEAKVESFQRHWRGEQEIDEFGMDEEYLDAIRPILNFFYKIWWRVSTHGIGNVPGSGRTMMAVNHSGVLPFDAAMVMMAIWNRHPEPRPVRALHLSWFATIPFLAPALARTGQVVACPENARALLERDQLVSVFPEGIKGVGKLYRDRYKLARFGRGGFIKIAMQTLSPIVPVAVVGAEEIYPAIGRLDWLGEPLGLPYLPVTPTFPWLGPLGLIPLPSKWHIDFCKPVKFKENAREMAEDYLVVSLLTEMIRKEIQSTLLRRLERRRSIWY